MNNNVKLDKQKDVDSIAIHGLSHDGRGIATINKKTTFVQGALPSEKITYKLTQSHPHYNEAEVSAILIPAAERTSPPCQHFGYCGGCSLQHMSTEKQLAFKEATLIEQLEHFGQVKPERMLPPLHANDIGYRRKARLGVKFVIKKNKVLVGFREKSSRYLADLTHCPILHPIVGERLTVLSDLIASLSCYKDIPQIEVAIGDKDAALIFRHLSSLTTADLEKLSLFGQEYGFHLYLQPNPPLPVTQLWPQDSKQRLTYRLPDYDLHFLFHPLDFTQINLEVNRLMVKQAIEALQLKPEDTVLDLFCGIGNFTLAAARYAKQVTGIEGSAEMVHRAEENAAYNQIKHVEFFASNLMSATKDGALWAKKQYNKIILDPPRAGAKEILSHLQSFQAERIVYISCNPATLARDAGILVHQHGYHLCEAGIMNMFPHTAHIEAMAIFEKK